MKTVTITIYPQDILSAFAEVKVRDATRGPGGSGPLSGTSKWGHRRANFDYCSLCPVGRAARRAFPEAREVSAAGKMVVVEGRGDGLSENWESPMIGSVIRAFDDSDTSLEVLERFNFPLSIDLKLAWVGV